MATIAVKNVRKRHKGSLFVTQAPSRCPVLAYVKFMHVLVYNVIANYKIYDKQSMYLYLYKTFNYLVTVLEAYLDFCPVDQLH